MIICLLGWPYGLRIYLKEQKKIDDHSFPDFLTTYRAMSEQKFKTFEPATPIGTNLNRLIFTFLGKTYRFAKNPYC